MRLIARVGFEDVTIVYNFVLTDEARELHGGLERDVIGKSLFTHIGSLHVPSAGGALSALYELDAKRTLSPH
jgi:hypothetical protein